MAKINKKWIEGELFGTSALSDNTSVYADIDGFNVNGKESFQGLLKAKIGASSNRNETFTITGNYVDNNWHISIDSVGDSGVTIEITAAGQIQYKSDTYAGYTSGEFSFTVVTI